MRPNQIVLLGVLMIATLQACSVNADNEHAMDHTLPTLPMGCKCAKVSDPAAEKLMNELVQESARIRTEIENMVKNLQSKFENIEPPNMQPSSNKAHTATDNTRHVLDFVNVPKVVETLVHALATFVWFVLIVMAVFFVFVVATMNV